MQKKATVIETNGSGAIINMQNDSACDTCVVSGGCVMCKRIPRFEAENKAGAKNGDTVWIETPPTHMLRYAAAVFVFPIVAAFTAFFVLKAAGTGDTLTSAAAAAAFPLFFLSACFIINRHVKKSGGIVITEIIQDSPKPGGSKENENEDENKEAPE